MQGEIRLRRLFDDIPTVEGFQEQQQKALAVVAAMRSDVLLGSSVAAVADRVVADHLIVPLTLHWGARTVGSAGLIADIDIAAGGRRQEGNNPERGQTAIVEFIPFSGAAGLFDMRPSDPPPEPVHGSVRQAGLALAWTGDRPDALRVRKDLDLQEAVLGAWVTAVNHDADQFNARLRQAVRTAVKGRCTTLRSTTDVLGALGLPLHRQVVPHRASADAGTRQEASRGQDAVMPMARRGPGRPGWTRDLFEERLAEADRLTPLLQTNRALARHFRGLDGAVGALTGDHLGRLRRRYPDQGR